MTKKTGGLDRLEVENALRLLAEAKSDEELRHAIDHCPALSHPTFHRILMANIGGQDSQLKALESRIKTLFLHLAFREQERLVAAVPKRESAGTASARADFMPPFYAAIVEMLAGELPEDQEWALDPETDHERLGVELSEAVAAHREPPPYARTDGSSWCAVVVVCAACRRMRLDVRAFAVDLATRPDFEEHVAAGRLNNPACPFCAESVCMPVRVWVSDRPFPADALAAVSCLWRAKDGRFLFQPPPGAKRVSNNDELMMFRAINAAKGHRFPPLPGRQAGTQERVNLTVAYSYEELQRLLFENDDTAGIPLRMKALWDFTASDMRSGRYPLYAGENHVRQEVMAEETAGSWPTTRQLLELGGTGAYRRLAVCFIREAVAEKVGASTAQRAAHASDTCGAYRLMGQPALASAALARAQRLLEEANPADASRDLAGMMIKFEQSELAAVRGDITEGNRFVDEMLHSPLARGSTIEERCYRQSLLSTKALELKQRQLYGQALASLRENIAGWKALLAEVTVGGDPVRADILRQLKQGLSGALANLGGTLQEMGRHLKVIRIFSGVGKGTRPSPEDLKFLQVSQLNPAKSLALLDETAWNELDGMFPEGISERAIWRAAVDLLEQARPLAHESEAWDFFAIQSHRLALLLAEARETAEAESVMRSAVAAAARGGVYERLVAGYFFLAEQALNRGEGAEGLGLLRNAAQQRLRQLISLGHEASAGERIDAYIPALTVRAVGCGANIGEAVTLVESLKAATTAVALNTGRPEQPRHGMGQSGPEPATELMRRREHLRLRSIWGPAAEIKAEIALLDQQIAEASKAQSLLDQRFAAWVSAVEFDLADLSGLEERLARLGQNATLVGVCSLGQSTWVYALWQGGCTASVVDGLDTRRLQGTDLCRDPTRLAALADLLLQPVDERLRQLTPEDVLVFSLGDAFYGLPIGALPYRGRALCEQVSLCFVQGIGILEACLERPALEYRSALCVGGPSRPDLSPLPAAVAEADAIAGQFETPGWQGSRLLKEKATAAAFKRAAPSHDIVHIACHAERDRNGAGELSLMLAPDLRNEDSGELSEGRVLAEVLLRPGAHVTLAGCATGEQGRHGAALAGGLVPVLLVAGASTLIATLWPIEDTRAAVFQEHFYEQLLKGNNPVTSLAHTQRGCIRGELGGELTAPEVWAAYQLYGATAKR